MNRIILNLAPIGVFALMASVIGNQDLGILKNLSLYVIGLIAGVLIIGLEMCSIMLLISGLNLIKYLHSRQRAVERFCQ